MRPHVTTSNSWHMVRKLDQVGATMKKELVCTIEGCPYEINLEIVLTETDLLNMGYGTDSHEDNIAYSLLQCAPEKEVNANFLLWDFIARVNSVMDSHDTSAWGVAEWDKACPFLFECDPDLESDNDEALQKERETWV